MGTTYNRKAQKEKRQYLRSHMTLSEKILWYSLRKSQVVGYKFRRQHGIKEYIVDFYCPELRLAIEADGESHNTDGAKKLDPERQRNIEKEGICFLRFTDKEIVTDPDKVVERIADEVVAMTKHTLLPSTRGE
ncbi:MAG: endonuclease domain-containing protein, partial [Bacteroidota bacterium]